VRKSQMELLVGPSECKMCLKRKLQDKDVAQELILD
jgi:hypothetical protein